MNYCGGEYWRIMVNHFWFIFNMIYKGGFIFFFERVNISVLKIKKLIEVWLDLWGEELVWQVFK